MISKKQIEDEGKAQYHSWRNTRNKTNWAMTEQPSVFTGEKHDVATFIGKTSSAYNMGMESKAKEMEKAGVDPETIWQKTGTMRNYSNAWQQEIPDNEAKMTRGAAATTMALNSEGNVIPINPDHPQNAISSIIRTNTGQSDTEVVLNGNAGVLDHPKLYNAYEGLEEGAVTFQATDRKYVYGGVTPNPKQYGFKFYNTKTQKMDTYEGIVKTHGKDYADNITAGDMTLYGSDAWIESYKNPNTGVVDWGGVENEIKKTMVHELQHSIQVKEGWTLGGNSESLKPFVRSLIPEGFDFREAGHDSLDSYVDEMANFAYRHQLGEVQARLTENRMDLTAEERREHYPYKQGKYGLDVHPENIVKVRDRQNEFNAKTGDAHKDEGHSHREK